jgi:hypothetical protein
MCCCARATFASVPTSFTSSLLDLLDGNLATFRKTGQHAFA